MAYDTDLAERVRAVLNRARPQGSGRREIRMFGGLCFMVEGHMCCGVTGEDLVVRVGPTQMKDALAQPHVRPMDFTGRPLKGFVFVSQAGCCRAEDLARWVGRGLSFVRSLPQRPR